MGTRKTPEQKLKELEKKRSQIGEQIKKTNAVVRKRKRREDTRRKIIAGGIALKTCEHDPKFKEYFDRLLQEHVTRPEDKKLFEDTGA